MPDLNTKLKNTLFIDDNLDVMNRIPSASVDLIATDPPFNTAQFRSSKTAKYSDVWKLGKLFTQSLEDKLETSLIKQSQKEQLKLLFDLMQRPKSLDDEPTPDKSFMVFMTLRAIEMHRVLKETGSLYWQCDSTMSHSIKLMLDIIFGKQNFRNEIVWCYAGGGIPSKDYPRKHDIVFRYSKSSDYIFNVKYKEYGQHINVSKTRATSHGGGRSVEYNKQGTPVNDWWDDIQPIINWHRERMGYPTQKPLQLFERIIEASSQQGDLVLDPFCGCATTPIAALRLKRHFIGIDVNGIAMRLIQKRLELQAQQGSIVEGEYNPIRYIVNTQMLEDSISEINSMIVKINQNINALGAKPTLSVESSEADKQTYIKITNLEKDILKLEADRDFLQNQLTGKYLILNKYLPPLKQSTFKVEAELSPKDKEDFKLQQIEIHKLLDGTYKCPGYYSNGKHVKCLTKKQDGVYPTANTTTIQIDRIIPASMGGKYTKSNIQAICNKCNLAKRDNL